MSSGLVGRLSVGKSVGRSVSQSVHWSVGADGGSRQSRQPCHSVAAAVLLSQAAPWEGTPEEKKRRAKNGRLSNFVEDANYVLRKSKGAYWAFAGVAGFGTVLGIMGVFD